MNYSRTEENWNIGTHAFGLIASIVGSVFLLIRAVSPTSFYSSLVFGVSLCILYFASTSYHAAKEDNTRKKLRVFDHAAIFVLIAGTYTPVCILPLGDSVGILLLWIIWGIASAGIILKLFYTGKYDRLSTIMYVAMGWVAIFAIRPILQHIETEELLWLLGGGVFYTVGAVIYAIRKIPFNHAIFHFFVLGGSACHYKMIYAFISTPQ